MAILTLSTAWLNLASDPSQFVTLTFATALNGRPLNPQVDRMYGGVRFRAVSAGAVQQVVSVSAAAVSAADVATLAAWNGRLVIYRDDAGTKFACSFADLQVTRHPYDTAADVSFTVTEKSWSEAV